MDKVARTTNVSDNYMMRYNLPVDQTAREHYSTTNNNLNAERKYLDLYRGVWSDPCTNGRAGMKLTDPINKPRNYFGIAHFIPTPTRQLYHVGLPTGSTKSPLPDWKPPKQYTMCG